jgi:Domain of unknown function (DUF4352)
MTQPYLSPDGRYQWDGHQWVPNGPPPPAPRARPGIWPWIAGGVAVLFLGVCTLAAASSGSDSRQTAASPAQPAAATAAAAPAEAAPAAPAAPVRDGSCAPRPCANDSYGWIVTVGNVRYGASSGSAWQRPEAGNVFVTLEVTFTNQLAAEQHANPFHFVLRDGAGVKHKIRYLDSCRAWDAVNLTTGATFGPRCLAFEATSGSPAGLTLVWTPQPMGGDYDIPLS